MAQPLQSFAAWISKQKPGLKVFTGVDPVCPKCGPYEASEGIYPGHGQRKTRGGQREQKD